MLASDVRFVVSVPSALVARVVSVLTALATEPVTESAPLITASAVSTSASVSNAPDTAPWISDLAVAIRPVTVVAKFASSAMAAASSFSVFRRPGAESTRLATAVFVYDSAEANAAATSPAVWCSYAVRTPLEFNAVNFSFLVVELYQTCPTAESGLGSDSRTSTFRLVILAPVANVIPW